MVDDLSEISPLQKKLNWKFFDILRPLKYMFFQIEKTRELNRVSFNHEKYNLMISR